jgi:hypothetical protein
MANVASLNSFYVLYFNRHNDTTFTIDNVSVVSVRFLLIIIIIIIIIIILWTAYVVYWSEFLAAGPEVPGSIPNLVRINEELL